MWGSSMIGYGTYKYTNTMGEADWPKIREALDRMRPLASDALLAMFQITMGEATEKAAERTLQEAGQPSGAKPKRSRSSRRRRG